MLYEMRDNAQLRSFPPRYVSHGGKRVETYLTGWKPQYVVACFAPLHILYLSHDDGDSAIWLLDEDLHRQGGTFQELSPAFRHIAVQCLCTFFDGLWDALLNGTTVKPLNAAQRAFFVLPSPIRRQLLDIHLSTFESHTVYRTASAPGNGAQPGNMVDFGARRISLDAGVVGSIFMMDSLHEGYIRLLLDGTLQWPSLVDGRPLATTHGVYLDGNCFAYRVVDERHGMTFFVIADEIYFRASYIFIPEARLAICASVDAVRARWPNLAAAFFAHVVEYGTSLEFYLQLPIREIAHVWRGATAIHIGHVLWNDLTGIARFVRALPQQKLPNFLLFDAYLEPEMYARLEVIFPELMGLVVRHNASFSDTIAKFYEQGICLIKSTGIVVTNDLRNRVVKAIAAMPRFAAERDAAAAARARNIPIILIGLRTENRTISDLPRFYARLVAYLGKELRSAILVIDGHNARTSSDDDFIGSHGEALAARSPVAIEREIAALIKRHAAGTGLEVVDNVGRTVPHSLLWAQAAHLFVAPWGAGLAKYRWVCNLPGFIYTSRWNLENLGDLTIYTSTQYQEESNAVTFVDKGAVEDLPNERPLVQFGDTLSPSLRNFRLDEERVFACILGMVTRFAPTATHAATIVPQKAADMLVPARD